MKKVHILMALPYGDQARVVAVYATEDLARRAYERLVEDDFEDPFEIVEVEVLNELD